MSDGRAATTFFLDSAGAGAFAASEAEVVAAVVEVTSGRAGTVESDDAGTGLCVLAAAGLAAASGADSADVAAGCGAGVVTGVDVEACGGEAAL